MKQIGYITSAHPFSLSVLSMHTLPPELVNSIYSHLTQHDLVSLSLVCHAWSAATLPRLYRLPRITSLNQLTRFSKCTRFLHLVSVLDLSTVSRHVTDKHLRLPMSLSQINLSDCDKVSTHVMNALIRCSTHTLQSAVLINCKLNLETLDLLRQASRTRLTQLDLSGTMVLPCHAIDTPNHLEHLIEPELSQLQDLNLAGCNWVDSRTVANIGRGLPRLERLSLFWCDQVDFATCLQAVQQLACLRHLDLQHVPAVSSKDDALLLLDQGRLHAVEYSDRRRRATVQRNKNVICKQ
ncbi:hypothetical protein BJV82DRAFT_313504 [Fennellomyces sp. T-0311]|nr:hypothetical protein BJV82DRAFT_313504 [Fennellomyces sp. T-0311]